MINPNFVILGAVIALAGTSRYVLDTLEGKTRPNRVSWFMWTLAPMIAFAAEIHQGVGVRSLATFMAGFCPLLVLIASFVNRKSVWKLTKFDLTCGILSMIGLILWQITGQGNVAIFFSIMADGLAALPTVAKSYHSPESETWAGFFASGISAGIALLTIRNWTFANYGFPLYLMIICLLLTLLIKFELGPRLVARRVYDS